MKINHDIRSLQEPTTRKLRADSNQQKTFQSLVQSQAHQLQNMEMERLINDITKQGNKLARFRSFRDLAKFKQMIRRFLKEAMTKGLKVQVEHHLQGFGQTRKLATIQEVDQKLIELTEVMMDQEKKTVDLLDLIGEIKGLLLNIYI